jgi:hypothetical protein
MIFEEQVKHLSRKYFVTDNLVRESLNKALGKSYVQKSVFPEDKAYQLTERYLKLVLYKAISEE